MKVRAPEQAPQWARQNRQAGLSAYQPPLAHEGQPQRAPAA
ncbi:hypothetical protein [Longimycelium tulufanense]|nr:hypothetical protein [Longimycelium tulufanense]